MARDEIDWTELLGRQNIVSLALRASTLDPLPDTPSGDWCGGSPASEAQIQVAEERLGVRLPPSYRTFLKQANGWWHVNSFIYRLLPVEQIAWFRDYSPEWVQIWTEVWENEGRPSVPDDLYFDYETSQKTGEMRVEYLSECLAISDEGDSAILLLNPKVIGENGEWEAWFFANWAAGADRFRSFYKLFAAKVAGEQARLLEGL